MEIKLVEWNVSDAIGRVETLISNIETANELIVEQLIEKGQSQANVYHNAAPSQGVVDTYIDSSLQLNGSSSKGSVYMTGPSAVYKEFGTGEEGAADGHPLKWQTNVHLNGYNSGPFVSKHINKSGRHYWFIPKYKYWSASPYVEENGYTEGIPAGKVMYDTARYMRFMKNNIVAKNINGAIKTFNK